MQDFDHYLNKAKSEETMINENTKVITGPNAVNAIYKIIEHVEEALDSIKIKIHNMQLAGMKIPKSEIEVKEHYENSIAKLKKELTDLQKSLKKLT
jgi:prefoldin subunit 5